jgi:hypothetical protein
VAEHRELDDVVVVGVLEPWAALDAYFHCESVCDGEVSGDLEVGRIDAGSCACAQLLAVQQHCAVGAAEGGQCKPARWPCGRLGVSGLGFEAPVQMAGRRGGLCRRARREAHVTKFADVGELVRVARVVLTLRDAHEAQQLSDVCRDRQVAQQSRWSGRTMICNARNRTLKCLQIPEIKPWKVQMPGTKPWKVQLLQITEI